MVSNKPRVFLTTTFKLCENNGFMSTLILDFFKRNGFQIVDLPQESDFIVISTCGFDQERENLSHSLVDEYVNRYGKGREVVICGCLPKITPARFDSSRAILIGPKELYKFNDMFRPATKIEHISTGRLNRRFIDERYGFLDAHYVQICQGCTNACSYCAIKRAKGFVTSKPIEEVVSEVERGIRGGSQRFVFLADDCGSYGADAGVDFADLLNRLTPFDIRINVNYIEPREFRVLYPKIDAKAFAMIDFIDIPVQSTSQRILELMNRRYEIEEILETVDEVRRKWPRVYLETQVIYGFPSETREEFRDTFRLSEVFDTVIYFYYTDRQGVASSALSGKLPSSEMIRRTREILRHPRYASAQDTAEPPMVLLGYGLSESELLASIGRNCAPG